MIPHFDGVFDGNDHRISSLKIEGAEHLGLFGILYSNAEISNLTLESVDVNGTGDYSGALAGINYGIITSCYCTGKICANDNIGELVGQNHGNITKCYGTGKVSGNYCIGGLVGKNYSSIMLCYSKGLVIGNNLIGGLVGLNDYGGIITSNYSISDVNGIDYIGGLVGANLGSITSSYCTSTVNGSSDIGGLVGANCSPRGECGTITSSFWDTESSGLSISNGGTGKTTAQMQDINTFLNAGWDFMRESGNGTDDIWWIDSGSDYPRLCWELEQIPLKYSGGSGEPNNPYKITTAQDLIDLRNEPNDYNKHFVMNANIDLSEYLFDGALIARDTNSTDYGFNGKLFNGTFDGKGYVINNLRIIGQDYLGMFGQTDSGAVLSNIVLDNIDVNGTGSNIGGLAGHNKGGYIMSCSNNGMVRGNNVTGGLVGKNTGFIISSCNTGSVVGFNYVGGFVGNNTDGSIISCCNKGEISGNDYTGGLAGSNYRGYIMYSYSAGWVSGGEKYVGGLVGTSWLPRSNVTGTTTLSFWDIQTSGQYTSDGGTGLPTALMQDINIYLNAGWDFAGEKNNGTCNFWDIKENNYPNLTICSEYASLELQGSGTIENPYLIYDANDLGTVWSRPEAHYRLETDINLSDITWNQAVVPWFNGSLDGNSRTIQSLHIVGNDYLGLFGKLNSNTEISNLTLESVDINGVGDYIGGLAGSNYRGNITSCQSNGIVRGNNIVGGLMGYNFGDIFSSRSSCSVFGNESVGGLVGFNSMSISTSYSTGMTIGSSCIGGLVGENSSRRPILTSYSTGLVSGENDIGGLVGKNGGSTFNTSFWDIETSGQTTSNGGTGKTTIEMQDINTYLNAGWDFIGETDNGTEDIWWIDNGLDFPRLWWELETDN